jgi:8-oxo-dGTP diphosphatase
MTKTQNPLAKYTNKLRVRACGVFTQNNKILLIRHNGLGELNELWAPPGGGVDFGEHITSTIEREFKEETNLIVKTANFLSINEHIAPPLHAIELFYTVDYNKGTVNLGTDPEHQPENQIISALRFFSKKELLETDKRKLHPFVLSKIVMDIL